MVETPLLKFVARTEAIPYSPGPRRKGISVDSVLSSTSAEWGRHATRGKYSGRVLPMSPQTLAAEPARQCRRIEPPGRPRRIAPGGQVLRCAGLRIDARRRLRLGIDPGSRIEYRDRRAGRRLRLGRHGHAGVICVFG